MVYPAAVKNDVRVTTLPTLAPTASSKAYQMIQVDDTESSTWLLVLGGVILVVAVILFCLFMWYLKDKQHRIVAWFVPHAHGLMTHVFFVFVFVAQHMKHQFTFELAVVGPNLGNWNNTSGGRTIVVT